VTAANPPAANPAEDSKLTPRLIKLAIVVMLGALAIQLDATVISVAIEALRKQFDVPLSSLQWVGTGYLLALTMVIPIAGWSAQRIGARAMWMISMGTFLVGSLLCGFAWSLGSLIVFRVIQGLGGGLILPLGQAILIQEAGVARRGKLMSVFAVPAILGPVLGPVIGGVFVTDLNWRWIFFINLPVCLIALYLSWRVIPNTDFGARTKLDVLGLALLSPGLAFSIYALSQAGNDGGFGSGRVVIPLVIGVLLLLGFGWHALRSKIQPIIDLRLLQVRSFATSSCVLFFFSTVSFGAVLLLPLYFQQVRGVTALHAGVRLIPLGIGTAVSLVVAGRLTDKIAPRTIVAFALTLSLVGFGILTQLGPHTGGLRLASAMVLVGLGAGSVQVSVTTAAYTGLRREAIPRASSAIRIFQQLGSSFGAATLLVVLQRELNKLIASRHLDPNGLAHAFAVAFWWTAAFTAVSLVIAFFLPRAPFRRPAAAGQAPKPESSDEPTAPVGA
jgi:EmrB/QacA subfamily drug resistance transporter